MSNVASSSVLASVLTPVLALVLAPMLALGVVLPAIGADSPETGEAAGDGTKGEVRSLSGTSVIGNREIPKSLYIVPWKNSEVGLSTDLSRDLLSGRLAPVDPNEFKRRIQFNQHNQQP